ncbi:MAG: RNA polymerase sigma-70 factor [Pseudomonadota bacterium]
MTSAFETVRPRLKGLAYRMLGSVADADDAVQDTYVKFSNANKATIENPEAWLVATCTRRCIDALRSAQKTRVDYVGLWLPEPLVGTTASSQADQVELAESLTTAFLLLLERLNPVERAAFLLRDVFDYDYRHVAAILGKSEPAVRQIVARAKKHVDKERARAEVPVEHKETLLRSFLDALASGRPDRLEQVLADDVELWGDGGGKVPAGGLQAITSAHRVARFLAGVWRRYWRHYELEQAMINGAPGLILRERGQVVGALSLAADDSGRYAAIFIVRNPDKLGHVPASHTAH